MSLREAVETAVAGREVPPVLLEAAFDDIMRGTASDVLISALLVALRMKGETVAEIVAAARSLRAHAVTAETGDPRTVDTCGTGGDGADTFNISTTAAFVVAGAGLPVAKHANRAASGRTGSVDVLEALGVRVDLPVAASARVLADVGVALFFARQAHPAMKHVAPVRQALGFRTMMNCLGPLTNPMGVRFQVVGVYSDALVEKIASALGELGAKRALVVHGSDGLDEVTTTGPTRAALFADGHVDAMTLDPLDHGIPRAASGALAGGDAAVNAEILRRVLDGEAGAPRDISCVNAAAALWVGGAAADFASGIELARRSIDSGAARQRLDDLVEATNTVAA
jgi:anthranilate phosphoribosyltransferase